MIRSTVLLLTLGLAAVSWAAPVPAAERVGKVRLIKQWAYERLMPRDWEDLFLEDPVFSNQFLRTPVDAAIHVRFVDGTELRVGADSTIQIDRYVYDPARGKGELAATLGKGAFRFISGKLKGYRIRTPTATVGVRGTDIIVAVLDDRTLMQVNKGIADMMACSRGTGRRFECVPATLTTVTVGETAGVINGQVIKGVDVPYDTGLDDDAGLASLNPRGGGPLRFDFSFGGMLENPNFTSNFSNTR